MTVAIDRRELEGLAFACLPECGFCCTFQPEVSTAEIGRLRVALGKRPLKLSSGEGRSYLQLQGGCGACTLLQRKSCTAYDARPAHCRYFPFHVYFGERPEAYVNFSCRGVETRVAGSLAAAFESSVLANAPKDALAKGHEAAVAAHAEFRRRAKRANAWSDPAPIVAKIAASAEDLLTTDALAKALAHAQVDLSPAEAHEEGLEPFEKDAPPATRPYFLAPDLRWLTFRAEDDVLDLLELDEAGNFAERGTVDLALDPLDAAERAALAPYFAKLLSRGTFFGSAADAVDESGYELGLDAALWRRAAEIASDLTVRARMAEAVLAKLPPARLAEETARFYDSEFLDASTIGGFL